LIQNARAQPKEQGSFWFQFSDPKANEAANSAVGDLTKGLSDLLSALNSGRKANRAIDVEIANQAIGDFDRAEESFKKLPDYIGSKKIDIGTIEKNGSIEIYRDLIDTLKRNGYDAPIDGKTFVLLLVNVTDNMIKALQVLRDYSLRKSGTYKDAEQAFYVIISQKILLEKFGATTSIISIATQ